MSPKQPKSNIMPISNVYPLNKTLMTDEDFQKQVRGRNALGTMVKKTYGLGHLHFDEVKGYLTAEQQLNWDLDTCSLLRDNGEKIYGPVLRDGKIQIECRCWKVDCHRFSSCRPGIDPVQVGLQSERLLSLSDYVDLPLMAEETPACNEIETFGIAEPEFNGHHQIANTQSVTAEVAVKESVDQTDDVIRQQIITASPSSRLFVSAGPGTGKTHTLIERLKHIVMEYDLNPAQEVLVLCFTRTAVREARERLLIAIEEDGLTTDLYQLNIRTFDSFATALLHEFECDTRGRNYDERIEMAIQILRTHGAELEPWRHLFVDEIQDLVGVRARFVQELLRFANGFTLLGDPLQGIYDYQVDGLPQEMDSQAFRREIESEYEGALQQVRLFVNRRQKGQWAQFAAASREQLLSGEVRQRDAFLEQIRQLPMAGPFHQPDIQFADGKTVGILCRNNGEVLKLSGYLQQQNIQHVVRKQGALRLLPSWVSDVYLIQETVTRSSWQKWSEQHGLLSADVAVMTYDQLKQVEGKRGQFLDKTVLRDKLLREEGLPEQWGEGQELKVTLTTIHQSKGREFDRVYVVDKRNGLKASLKAEARVLYVAVTRAREELYSISAAKNSLNNAKGERWYEISEPRGNKQGKVVSLEVGTEDLEEESFVMASLGGVENQTYIRDEVRHGDPIDLVWNMESGGYDIVHCDKVVGRMARAFEDDVRQILKKTHVNSNDLPQEIRDLHVQQLYTVVRPPLRIGEDVAEPYAVNGVWLGVSVLGMGRPEWKGYEPMMGGRAE